jgi:hypothetical protein
VRYLVFLFLAFILYNLGSALFHISRSKQTNPKVVRNLTLRVAFSIALFLILIVSNRLGWIGDKL